MRPRIHSSPESKPEKSCLSGPEILRTPQFRRHIYYDRDESLFSNGIRVRKRSGHWQAKIRRGADYTNSQFGELSDPEDIAWLIRKFNSNASTSSKDFGLESVAQYTTLRDAWKADDKFEIVLDTTDFGHCVGEVELQHMTEIDGDRASPIAMRQALGKEMDCQIEAFMQHYSWAFPSGKPVGKLSAYFDWKRGVNSPISHS